MAVQLSAIYQVFLCVESHLIHPASDIERVVIVSNPVTVAAITGHDPKVLFHRYAGLINKPEAPEIF